MSASWILQTDSWDLGYRRIAESGSVLLESLYQKANRFRLGPINGGDLFQAAFLNICLCLPYVIFHHYRAAIVYLTQRVLHPAEAQLPGFVDSVNVPKLYPIVHLIFIVSLFAPRSLLPTVVVGGVFALALLGHLFDPLSALMLIAFLAVVYLVFTVSWMSRAWKLGCALAIYVVILIPRRFPDLMDRLRVRESIVWSMLGIVVTSIFYSTLFVLRDKCETPIEWWGFMQRLLWI